MRLFRSKSQKTPRCHSVDTWTLWTLGFTFLKQPVNFYGGGCSGSVRGLFLVYLRGLKNDRHGQELRLGLKSL